MPYDDLRKGRWSEAGHAYFVTTVLADRQSRWFADFWCARLVIAEMRDLHNADAVASALIIVPASACSFGVQGFSLGLPIQG